jgi:hypothetical protein
MGLLDKYGMKKELNISVVIQPLGLAAPVDDGGALANI